jgi:hypothetical protein
MKSPAEFEAEIEHLEEVIVAERWLRMEAEAKLAKVVEKAQALLSILVKIEHSSEFLGIFTVAAVHGCKYRGDTWGPAMRELAEVLAAVKEGK